MEPAILLADDSSTIQRLVERTFDETDFRIVAVSNGEAAVRKLEELEPVAVLADIHMPGRNGYEVCAFVKQHPRFSAIPVVLLVGAFEAFDDAEAKRVGADASVTKPFEPKKLVEIVTDLTGRGTVRPAPETQAGEPLLSTEPEVDGDEERESDPPPSVRVAAAGTVSDNADAGVDLLGLTELFPAAEGPERRALSPQEVDAIADRVIEKLSSEVVESIAWDIVPEIADRVMRDEVKRKQ